MSPDAARDPEKRLTGAHLLVANVALLGGIVTGLLLSVVTLSWSGGVACCVARLLAKAQLKTSR